MIIGSTSLLGGDTPNRIHIVIPHVGTLGGKIFWRKSVWELLTKQWNVSKGNKAGNETADDTPRWHLRDLNYPAWTYITGNTVRWAIEGRARPKRWRLIPNFNHGDSLLYKVLQYLGTVRLFLCFCDGVVGAGNPTKK
mmetsp:Transcript_6891/g.10488  ORF Transcript_6891/g.10488 Transcript_6891/m.10488 type:complete len:138 (+) Transcript_6891:371-784(+)